MSTDPILVVGHKNPDNDSVVSARTYAYLKNQTDPANTYVAGRLGPMPKESAWLFEEYDIEVPREIADIYTLFGGEDEYTKAQEGIEDPQKPRLILVDHNEVLQAIEGIGQASVVEMIDHHRIGDVQTAQPIMFLNLPVGSTATIITTRFDHANIEIPKPIAALLLSAVLTDTVLLKSPTATELDRRIVKKLAKIVEVEPIEFGLSLFRKRTEGVPFDPSAILDADAKEFQVGDNVVYIVQYETVDLKSVTEHLAEVQAEADRICAERGYEAVVLMITDILEEGSEIVAAGNIQIPEKALGISLASGSAWMPGVLSRKKQVAAKVVALGS